MSDKISRLVEVLDVLLRSPGQAVTLSEVVQAVDRPLSSTHDLLRAMTACGLLEVDSAKRYRAGATFTQLARRAMHRIDVAAVAQPHLERLVDAVGHDAYLAVRAGDAVSYVSRCAGTYRAGLDIKLGEPVSLHSSAVGKLFAALQPDLEARVVRQELVPLTSQTIVDRHRLAQEFREIRERDTSISIEETITGIIGFGAPVRDAADHLVAAVHVSAFKDNLGEHDIPVIEQATRTCAADVRRALALESLTGVPA